MAGGGDKRSLKARAAQAARDQEILARRLQGETVSSLAVAFDLSVRAVFLSCARSLRSVRIPCAAAAKKAMLVRLDLIRSKLCPRLENSDVVVAVAAARTLIAVEAREAVGLLGLGLCRAR